MLSRKRKISLQVVSVILVAVMLMCQAMHLPHKAYAAVTDLYVGYSGKSNNFSTVQEAVNKAASINPSSESERVTIHIAPGTYREQIVVQTPYVSFVNEEPSKGEVLLTWYYGIGYKYYSANAKGYYDASAAQSKSAKNIANYRWGATVQLWPKAQYFKAENITFENSFNRYITDEEIADGVEATGETLTVARTSGADVRSKAYTERAAALSADAAYCEFLNCSFLSSQDTLYTGGSPEYYKNCHIEGNTDYIFGDGSVVFDSCELSFYGYSSGSVGGYITAARDDDNDDTGYLFSNCTITKNPSLTVKTGYLGRPWRDTAKVMFVNTTLTDAGLIDKTGWTSMSGVQPETVSGFKEYGTKLPDGTAADLSSRKGNKISDSDAAGIKLTSYMKNWTPTYLNASPSQGTTNPDNTSGAIKLCGGWFEEAFAEWDSSEIGSNVKVSYAQSGSSAFTAVDAELIRGSRVDIPGLKGNTSYDIKIEGSAGSAVCTVKTMAFDRSGYAHWNYSSGVGAYNNDGTLKSGAEVIYVTNSNKDTITYGGKTGLYNIFSSAKPKNVVFRFIGDIDVPAGSKANDGKQNDGSSMLYLQYAENVTVEGIGYNASLNKWGFEIKRSESVEVRNLYLAQYPDDGISVTGGKDQLSQHIWIHNNTILSGYNAYAGNGTVDADKADGDGSTDIKYTHYVTVSYNCYDGCHKTSLVGGGVGQLQDWITYHHNWFNGTESRNPRAREAHIHSYNNYFVNNKQYGIGASYNSKVFSEANYFSGTYHPLAAEAMGSDAYSGTIKSYNDKFDNCNMGSGMAYKTVSSRNEQAAISNAKSGGEAYDNFDLDSSKIYSYTAQTPEAAKTEVENYAGRMQNKAYNAGNPSDGPATPPAAEFTDGSLFTFKNVNSGLYMEVEGGTAANSSNVQQWGKDSDQPHNTWKLVSAGNGYYYIYSALGDGNTYVLDVAGKKADNGTNIAIYQFNGADNQQFKFMRNSDGSYKILTKISGDKSTVEVVGAEKNSGANVQQWENNGVNCQDWIPEPAKLPINGKLVRNLVVSDSENGSDWSISQGAKNGDLMFGDRDFTISGLPSALNGAERIITACDSKNTDSELASFTAGKDITVYVAMDNRVAALPSWLSDWTDTGDSLTANDTAFVIYSKEFNSGDSITLGTNGQSASCMNYAVFIQEKSEDVSSDPEALAGDSNCDGAVNMADAILIMQSLANPDKYGVDGSDSARITHQGMINADVQGSGNGVTNMDALEIQKYKLGLVAELKIS